MKPGRAQVVFAAILLVLGLGVYQRLSLAVEGREQDKKGRS